MTDSQQRLERSLKTLLGENTPIVRVYKYEEVLNLLLDQYNNKGSIKTSVEFFGSMEPVCESRLRTAGIRFETKLNANKQPTTTISW